MAYDWQAGLVLLVAVIALTKLGKLIAFQVPAIERMREINEEMDAPKRKRGRFQRTAKASANVGLVANVLFFFGVAPFLVTLEPMRWWRFVTDIVLILMVYDFLYYLTHRFVFHGKLLRKVHAVHHEAHHPSHADAYYVHPTETAIGLALYFGTIVGLGLWLAPFHAATLALNYVIYVQWNVINHTFVDLPYFPFRTLDYVTTKHHKHHENMGRGNYATITMAFDRMFGTLD